MGASEPSGDVQALLARAKTASAMTRAFQS
jgi:hypothetical protein